MAAKHITTEAIVLTEKKMDMTLDDIIKMSKITGTKGKKQQRVFINNKKVPNNAVKDRSAQVQSFMDSRSSIRQGFLAQRRSQFQGNQFSLATEVAKKAAVAPLSHRSFAHNRGENLRKPRFGVPSGQRRVTHGGFGAKLPPREQPKQALVSKQRLQTLDARFADMKEQRMKILLHESNSVQRKSNTVRGFKQRRPWGRDRFAN